jgi:hypothetical protein
MSDLYDLPDPPDLEDALDWLRAGCPATARHLDAKKAAQTLLKLLHALPGHIELYQHGSPENERACQLWREKQRTRKG